MPFFCLAVQWGGALLSDDWAAKLCFVVINRLLSVLESRGVLSVLEHLHAGLIQGEVLMCFEEPSQSRGLFFPLVLIPLPASLEVKMDLRSSSLPLRPALVQFNHDDYAVLFVFRFKYD